MFSTIESLDHIQEGIDALIASEPRFSVIFQIAGLPPLRRLPGGYAGLLRIITEQQISLASAKAIWGRMVEQHAPLDPLRILTLTDAEFRTVGQSAAKIRTIRNLSQAIADGLLDVDGLVHLPDDEVRKRLMAIPGIGPWTADVFLLACLGRQDAWPAGDLALQVAAAVAFELPARPSAKEMLLIAEPWRPWRAVAARLIWAYYATLKPQPIRETSPL
ncbi:DNA-3-methyladenine glycosylase II [Rhodoligotrophos appendicifer]|uniref:DNA-3-methyladenine glycosylase family protein n=1 Tax=Rhodoligotrophos appendicifer TaxID=987056 RepID=UPI00118478BA|nr:DNA-3-methyladenine glycosylase [Rhodoligotrophos appendicifer]